MAQCKRYQHRWVAQSISGDVVTDWCCDCGQVRTRKVNKRKYQEYQLTCQKSCEEMHGPYLAMENLCLSFELRVSKGEFISPEERVNAALEIESRFPDKISTYCCDDRYHSGSTIFVIDTSSELEGTHGTWLYFFPMSSGDPVARMFFSPEAMGPFLSGLRGLHAKQNKNPSKYIPKDY